MQNIQTLKNNSKGKKTLQSLIDGMPLTPWFCESLKDLQKQEEKAPWKMLFLEYEEDLCLLVQHSDPDLRYQACSILVYSETKTCRRILWDQFADSHQDIRILMIKLFQSSDRQKLYNTLFRHYIKDPVFKVRQEALYRIKKDFADLYTLYSENLDVIEKIHCLELLDVKSSHDHNLALRLMNDSHPGIILAASLYLEKSGSLDQLITKGSSRDLEDLTRRKKILSAAADHQVSSFLNKKENFSDKGALFLAVEIFHRGVSSSNFAWIIAKVFDLKGESPFINNLKDKALSCLIKRKDPESIFLLKQLLEQKLFRSYRMEYLLNSLPPEGSILFYPVLKKFLLDKDFPYWPSLIQSFVNIPLSLCLSDLYTLVRNHESDKIIRKRAVLLLSRYGEFSSTLFILENLS
ncbi:hypothetical protein [Oceanispirochaeta sp.]|jgi:hypothetical protein|uniref:hypothetical protein n=1 Tax=Oceanispirochaeta sp. TaxID=2035350 RepID=UPI0026375300|nr:hypothetical protein [Oceanispirochaeta sp.]MDA3956759.1 hypothetical protein [Oceanispirochaeta sp.]